MISSSSSLSLSGGIYVIYSPIKLKLINGIATVASSTLVQLAGGNFNIQNHSHSYPNSLTFTRRKSYAVVKAASRVDKFSKSDIIVSPSFLSADFSKLGEQVKAVELAGYNWIHIDVMDGRFVPNIMIGPLVVDALRPSQTSHWMCIWYFSFFRYSFRCYLSFSKYIL